MLGFFKPKISIDTLAERYALVTQTILTPSMNSKVDEQIEAFVAAGAVVDTVRLELAAFNAFNTWAGVATAHQRNRLTQEQVDRLLESFDDRLRRLAQGTELDRTCSSYFGKTLCEFVNSRMEVYISIGTSPELEPKEVRTSLVDAFCGFASRGEASAGFKWQAFQNYVLTSGAVYDVIAASKVI